MSNVHQQVVEDSSPTASQSTSVAASFQHQSDASLSLTSKNQPPNFTFPKRNFGNYQPAQSFLPEWFQRFPWLHYNEATDSAFCFHCMKAGNIAHSSKRDDAFISRGFTNCKNATSAFKKHEERSFHNQVISLTLLPQQCGDIGEIIDNQVYGKGK